MSEIIKKIEASMTGTRYAQELSYPLLSTKVEMNKSLDQAFLNEYFVGVRLGHKVRIDESVSNQREEAMKIIKRSITELIFGEFRHLLVKAQYNLYDRNFDEAKRAIEEIEQRMFYEWTNYN